GFKAYNDVHGHQAGDHLLVGATGRWRRQVREVDLLARRADTELYANKASRRARRR
ncbi:MAG: diguanylate cyclase domain-containing protein, partial [Gaiellaceae bacterium]